MKTPTGATIEPLSKEDVKALRAANDSVVLRHFEDQEYMGQVEALIRTDIHGQSVEVRVAVPVNSAITNYEEGRASDHPASDEEIAQLKLRADYIIHYPNEDCGPWRTITSMLKVGDQIQLHWIRGNHNMLTRKLGLSVDEVKLNIIRQGKTVARFMVGYSVGHRNCARMVRSVVEQTTYL